MEVNVWTYIFEPPGPAFSESDDTKFNWPEMSGIPDLADYPEFHEVLGSIIYFTGPFTNTSPIYINYKIFNHSTNTKIWETNVEVPTPPEEWWDWYKWKFWTGHASWEINGPMTVRIEINLSGWVSGSATLYMDVIDTTPTPPPSEWRYDPNYRTEVANCVVWQYVPEYNKWYVYHHNQPELSNMIMTEEEWKSVVPSECYVLPTIEETIDWEATVPSGSHSFYLISLYGTDTNNTLEEFQTDGSGRATIITTPSMSRSDKVTSSNITNFDCLTLINDVATGQIYDWRIDNNVI